MTQDQFAALQAAYAACGGGGVRGMAKHVDSIDQYLGQFTHATNIHGEKIVWGRARLRRALLQLDEMNLVVRYSRALVFVVHAEGAEVVEAYWREMRERDRVETVRERAS